MSRSKRGSQRRERMFQEQSQDAPGSWRPGPALDRGQQRRSREGPGLCWQPLVPSWCHRCPLPPQAARRTGTG